MINKSFKGRICLSLNIILLLCFSSLPVPISFPDIQGQLLSSSPGKLLAVGFTPALLIIFCFRPRFAEFLREFDLSANFCISVVIQLCCQHNVISPVYVACCFQHCDGIKSGNRLLLLSHETAWSNEWSNETENSANLH